MATPRKPRATPSAEWEVLPPLCELAPVVFASPHSGRVYTRAFVKSSRLDQLKLRRSEDAFMDEIFAAAPEFGAPLLRAHFPRAYVDANREPYELDPEMFSDRLPDYATTKSPRLTAGLGTVARVVTNGEEIYHHPLRFAEARRRIEQCHAPYHKALRGLLNAAQDKFGGCLLVDCHSMPSSGNAPKRRRAMQVDVVLGDCYGSSCAPAITNLAEHTLAELGFSVIRNKPYAGGYTTRHYGRPDDGVHVLQIEISRALYMDEEHIQRTPDLNAIAHRMARLVKALTAIDPAVLKPLSGTLKAAE